MFVTLPVVVWKDMLLPVLFLITGMFVTLLKILNVDPISKPASTIFTTVGNSGLEIGA